MNYFIINIDTSFDYDFNFVHYSIENNTQFKDWWHYTPSLYIVETEMSAKDIADYLISIFPGLHFLVLKADINQYSGALSPKAWEWFKNKTKKVLRLKPVSAGNTSEPAIIAAALKKALKGYNGEN